jgi:hypothetical protein
MKERTDNEMSVQSTFTKMLSKGTNFKNVSAKKSLAMVTKSVHCLGPYDVICGRHKDAWNNVGNRRFRIIVALSVVKYIHAPTRAHKSTVIRDIVDTIHSSGGRFLQQYKCRNASTWEELDEKQMYDKVGHALRDMSSSWKEKTDMINLLCPNQTASTTRSSTIESKSETDIKSQCQKIVSNIPSCVSSHTSEICEYSTSQHSNFDDDDDDCTFIFDDDFDDLTNYSLTPTTTSTIFLQYSDHFHNGKVDIVRIERNHSIDSVAVISSIFCL